MFDLETHIVHMKDVKNQKECFFISAELGQRCADALQGGLPMLGPASQLPAHISPCLGPDGKTFAYVLSRELWNEVKYDLRSGEKELFFKHGGVADEDLEDFREFLMHWDCDYDYSGKVHCLGCGTDTEDWRTDPGHPFVLSNANTGGLLVFQCSHCGATIRLKHFRDEVVCEHTMPYRP